MKDVLIDALVDSLKVFLIAWLIYFLLAFIAPFIFKTLVRHKKVSPLFGSILGIVPECGLSVVAADLYLKKAISTGTIIAIFIASSDEALPVLFASSKWSMAFLLICVKIVAGFIVGFGVDLFLKEEINLDYEDEYAMCSRIHRYLWHPLTDALKVLFYVLIINIIFGFLIYFIGEDNIVNFISSSYLLSPILSILLGLIPNCAPSILVATLYVNNAIPFGAMLASLIVNSGLGMLVILKNKNGYRHLFLIFSSLIITALILGYAFIFVS